MAKSLMLAVEECRYIQMKLLMKQGIHINVSTDDGHNALITSLKIDDPRRRLHMFKWLMHHGADTIYVDKVTGRDLLTWAAIFNRTPEMRLIMQVDAGLVDFNAKDKYGRSALHYATMHNNPEAVRMITAAMKKYGLSVDVADHTGLTPYIMASVLGFQECARILRTLGDASPNQVDIPVFDMGSLWAALGEIETKPSREKAFKLPSVTSRRPLKRAKAASRSSLRTTSNNDNDNDNRWAVTTFSRVSDTSRAWKKPGMQSVQSVRTAPQTSCRLPEILQSTASFKELKESMCAFPMVSASKHSPSTFIPALMDLLAQQTSYTYRPPARPPTPPRLNTSSISFRTAVKISAFAVSLRKRRDAKLANVTS